MTVIDNHDAGTAAALVDERMAGLAKAKSARKGYLDGRALAEVFAWLRPGDLVWNYWVNNYLLGKRPPAFDILFWNSDTTRMTAALHADFVDLAMENSLTRPGALTVLGVPIDLGKITVDSYVVAGIADHITPWESCYRSAQLFGGTTRFVLSTSGHIAALVNPPGNPKASFHTNDDLTSDAKVWLKDADVHAGHLVDRPRPVARRTLRRAAPGARGARVAPPERARGGTRHLRLRQVTRFLRVRVLGHDVRVAVRPGTAPGPPLVLCNGIGASLDLLQPFVDEVDPRIEVVRFDVPGVGGSPTPKVPYNFALLAWLVGRLLDRLGYDRFDALGISWGGGLAQQLAFQYPRRCRRLVLVSTGTGMSDGAGPPQRAQQDAHPAGATATRPTPRPSPPQLYGGRMRRRPDEVRHVVYEQERLGPRVGYFLQLLAGVGWTSLPALPLIRQPTLILAGNDDPIIPLVNARIMRALLPHATLHVFDDGHLGLLTSADELGPLVSRFLTGGGRGGGGGGGGERGAGGGMRSDVRRYVVLWLRRPVEEFTRSDRRTRRSPGIRKRGTMDMHTTGGRTPASSAWSRSTWPGASTASPSTAAATPYWAPCPSSVLGRRLAAPVLRAEADQLVIASPGGDPCTRS